MDVVLKYRSQIYGILSIWVLLFHLNAQIGFPELGIKPLSELIKRGDMAVDVFLFLAGYCASLSLVRCDKWDAFMKKRFLRVGLPLLIIAIPYFAWRDCFVNHLGLLRFCYDVSGLSFWVGGDLDIWFGVAIILLYLLSPAIYRIIRDKTFNTIILIGLLVTFIFCLAVFDPHLIKVHLAWMRFPIYVLGMICGCQHPFQITLFNSKISSIIVYSLIFFSYLFISIKDAYPELSLVIKYGIYLSYILLVVPFLYLTSSLVSILPWHINALLGRIGQISFEFYLIHTLLLCISYHYGISKTLGFRMLVIIPVITVILSFLVRKLCERIRTISVIQMAP